jgi:hypothetical protein
MGFNSAFKGLKTIHKNFSATVFVSRGSNSVTLAHSATETIGNLTKNYVLVFWWLQMA